MAFTSILSLVIYPFLLAPEPNLAFNNMATLSDNYNNDLNMTPVLSTTAGGESNQNLAAPPTGNVKSNSKSSSPPQKPDASVALDDVKQWAPKDYERVVNWARGLNIDLEEDDLKALRRNRIDGPALIEWEKKSQQELETKFTSLPYNLPDGKLFPLIKSLQWMTDTMQVIKST